MKERGGRRDGGRSGGGIGDLCEGSPTPLGRVANDNDSILTMTRGELALLLREAALETVRQLPPELLQAALVDKQGMAARLMCSASHIDLMRKRGLPTVLVGQAVRFEPAAVIAWLREHSAH